MDATWDFWTRRTAFGVVVGGALGSCCAFSVACGDAAETRDPAGAQATPSSTSAPAGSSAPIDTSSPMGGDMLSGTAAPPAASFFAGVWEARGRTTLACDADLSALSSVAWDPAPGDFRQFVVSADSASYVAHKCSSATECNDAPLAGETFTLTEGAWTGTREDYWTSEGAQCIYNQQYHEHWVSGETLYDVIYLDARPVEGNPEESFGCLANSLPTFECGSLQVTWYERYDG